MNPINLLLPDGSPSKVWACGECNYISNDQAHAEKCCSLSTCRFCGELTEKKYQHGGYHYHDACWRSHRAKEAMERLEKAEKLEAWDDWVSADHGPNDGFFENLAAYVDWLVDEIEDPNDWPDWVHVANSRPGCVLDIGSILESACDDGYEDMDEDLSGTKELQAAIDAFNKANEGVVVYDTDFKRAVRVPRPEATPDA